MNAKAHFSAYSLKDLGVMLMAAVFAVVLAGCAGAGTKTGEFVDDSTITTKVKSAFATDKTVSAIKVHVDTEKGNVKLSGTVKSDTEKQRASEIARSVAGVKSVSNNLVVKSEGSAGSSGSSGSSY
jgi:hyperosmotically inducible protein